MKERKKRSRILAFVGMGLVVVGLLSLSSSAWATPAEKHAQQQTVPPVKTVDNTVVDAGDELVFEIALNNPTPNPWSDVVITDDLDRYVSFDSVTTTHGAWTYDATSNRVTVTIASLPAGETVTITIYCTVWYRTPPGYEIENIACLTIEGVDKGCSGVVVIVVEEGFVPEMGSLLLLGSGVAALAGYAGMKWGVRRK